MCGKGHSVQYWDRIMWDVWKRLLTVVGCEEGGLVDVILHVRGLSVQSGQGGDLPVRCVDPQPVGRV